MNGKTFFNKNLYVLRKANGYSQIAMASAFNVSQSGYNRWEKEGEPDLETVVAIADFFKIPLDVLLKTELKLKVIEPSLTNVEQIKSPAE